VLPAGLGDQFSIALLRHAFAQCQSGVPALPRMVRRESAHLNPHRRSKPQEYVSFMGGAEAVLERARASFAEGDYRWVVEVVNHVVFADPENEPARLLQADASNNSFPERVRTVARLLSHAPWNCDRTHVLRGCRATLWLRHREFDDARTAARLDRSSSNVRGPRTSRSRSNSSSWIAETSDGALVFVTVSSTPVATCGRRRVGVISSIAAFAFSHGSKNFDELIAREDSK